MPFRWTGCFVHFTPFHYRSAILCQMEVRFLYFMLSDSFPCINFGNSNCIFLWISILLHNQQNLWNWESYEISISFFFEWINTNFLIFISFIYILNVEAHCLYALNLFKKNIFLIFIWKIHTYAILLHVVMN